MQNKLSKPVLKNRVKIKKTKEQGGSGKAVQAGPNKETSDSILGSPKRVD
jgi:hypothetical protein